MVVTGVPSLHVYGKARPRSRKGGSICQSALSYELRQPGPSPDTRGRRVTALANASYRWLRCLARSRLATRILQARIGEVGLRLAHLCATKEDRTWATL